MLSVHFSQLPSKVSRLLVNSRSLYPKLLKIYPKGPTWSQTSALASHSPAGPFLHWPSLAKGWEEGNTCLLLSCKHHDHPLFWLPPLLGQELLTFPIGNTSHLTGILLEMTSGQSHGRIGVCSISLDHLSPSIFQSFLLTCPTWAGEAKMPFRMLFILVFQSFLCVFSFCCIFFPSEETCHVVCKVT